ncbi:unnamed protein product [marine sediment metagenome]|uniref:Uncharacterized protein n=1 Tax=marine sediment metagenome TaxID=412755 RepID=X1A6X8_9ZZZZ
MTVGVGDLVKAVATHELLDDVISQSIWYWVMDSAGEIEFSVVLAGIVAKVNEFYAEMEAQIHQDTALTSLVANLWEWDAEEGWETGALIGVDTLTDAFATSTDMFPHAVAMTMTGFTQLPRTRSRKSVSGFADSTALSSEVTGAVLSTLAAALAVWLTDINLGGGVLMHPVVPKGVGGWEYLLYGLVSGLVGSQRQRKPGIGV